MFASSDRPSTSSTSKPPRHILPNVYAFAPNRETLGGTAYTLLKPRGNILVDCPRWESGNRAFLQQWGIRYLFITHRDAMSRVAAWQKELACEVVVQEQEAYLLPDVRVTSFAEEMSLSECEGIWTCGFSPGSACLYDRDNGGVLFCGRHLLPTSGGAIAPLRMAKTFHWGRQLQSVKKLCDRFCAETLYYLCPGANTGFLRGKGVVEEAYPQLQSCLD